MAELETEKVKKWKAERARIDALIREEEKKLRVKERKRDTRRKVMAGAVVLEWAKEDSAFATQLNERLGRFLVRDNDRALYGLPPLGKTLH